MVAYIPWKKSITEGHSEEVRAAAQEGEATVDENY